MSRVRESEVSSPISLFPFIGILLCTMGALLVILVAVSRSAGDSAKREVAERQQSGATAAVSDENRQELNAVNDYLTKLKTVRGEAEKKLRDEQARLSHLEDHIRRLREQMKSLQAAAGELQSLEAEHYDDRKQAEQEVKRLRELIDESQTTIDSLREQAAKGKHSYALVPYEGPNGTHRRPMYIECADSQLILQPEGVRISSDELVPPFGAGNPLAAALRAARDHIIRLHPNEGQGRDTEPYALVLVRPTGLMMFSRARAAIEAGDFDMGYELVESDWKLKYPAADLSLSDIQHQAIEQALARQQMLAAAAPRAYRNPALVAAGQFDEEDDTDGPVGRGEADGYVVREKESTAGDGLGGDDGGAGGNGSGSGGAGGGFPGGGSGAGGYGSGGTGGAGGYGGGGAGSAANGGVVGSGSPNAKGAAGGAGPPADESAGQIAGPGGSAIGGTRGANSGNGTARGVPGGNATGGAGGNAISSTNGGSYADSGAGPNAGAGGAGSGSGGGAVSGGMSASANAVGSIPMSNDPNQQPQPGNINVMTGSPPPGSAGGAQAGGYGGGRSAGRGDLSQSKGKDWALGKKPPRAVPIRRTIHVVVRQDQIAILPENAVPTNNAAASAVIPMKGDTIEAVDEFVTQIRKLVDGWGIAGDGLYWRPVLEVSVGPEGRRRASDLSRLLKNSGLELRSNDTAQNATQGHTK